MFRLSHIIDIFVLVVIAGLYPVTANANDAEIIKLKKQIEALTQKTKILSSRLSAIETSSTDPATFPEVEMTQKHRMESEDNYHPSASKLSAQPKMSPTPADYVIRRHVDGYVKLGNNRSLAGTEIFNPLSWNGEYLSFVDVRFVADDHNSKEGNFGLGLRRVPKGKDYLYGVYGFYDRKRSSFGKYFSQATIGAEFLTEDWDIHANGYIPLSGDKTISSGGGVTSLALSGTGIVAQGTVNTKTEKILSGFDLELGRKIPGLENTWFKDTRAYAGYFHFDTDNTKDISGPRVRLQTRIHDWLQIGLEHQNDAVRGATNFLEIRLRFPAVKKSGDHLPPAGIYARLDEQIVRDIDVITKDETVTTNKAVNVTNQNTGTDQIVYVVDNTVVGGGDGSAETPFNTLAGAQGAASADEIIYVRSGDGTNTGMNGGIVLDDARQSLIGSGSALVFDPAIMQLSGVLAPASNIIVAAGTAPLIGNAAGDAIKVSADNVRVTGIQANGATGDGIEISNGQNVTIENTSITGNAGRGLFVEATGANNTTLKIENIVITGNLGDGIELDDESTGSITADLGGGALGSAGNNDINANLGMEISADLDGGNLSAQGNFWGGGALTDTGGPDAVNINATGFDTTSTCTNCFLSLAGSFTNQTNVQENQIITANNLTASGFTGTRYVSVSGAGSPELIINGVPQGSTSGQVQSGDTISIRLTSATTGFATQTTILNSGDNIEDFNATTRFLPNAIGGLQLWLDANDIDGDFDYTDNPAGGAAISLWRDKSGSSNDVSQVNPGDQPNIGVSTINGQNIVTNAAGERLLKTGVTSFANTEITTISVLRTNASNNAILSYATVTGGDNDLLLFNDSLFINGLQRNVITNNYIDGQPHIVSVSWQNSDGLAETYIDGTLQGQTNISVGHTFEANGALSIFGEQDVVGGSFEDAQDFEGDMAEVLIFDSTLSTIDRQFIEQYLGTKYSITVP